MERSEPYFLLSLAQLWKIIVQCFDLNIHVLRITVLITVIWGAYGEIVPGGVRVWLLGRVVANFQISILSHSK